MSFKKNKVINDIQKNFDNDNHASTYRQKYEVSII